MKMISPIHPISIAGPAQAVRHRRVEHKQVAWRQRRGIRGHSIEARVRCRNGKFAAIGHGVARIDGEIEQRAFKLIGIAKREP